MALKRRRIGYALLGIFLAYFCSSLATEEARRLPEKKPISIVKLEKGNRSAESAKGLLRSGSENAEENSKAVDYFHVSLLENFHTSVVESRLALIVNQFTAPSDLYLAHHRLLI